MGPNADCDASILLDWGRLTELLSSFEYDILEIDLSKRDNLKVRVSSLPVEKIVTNVGDGRVEILGGRLNFPRP